MKIFAPIFVALGLATAAHAANLPGRMPIVPANLPGASIGGVVPVLNLSALSLPLSAPMALPGPLSPRVTPTILPGVPSPLPLPTPAALTPARAEAAPSIIEKFVLNWSLLDDKDGDSLAPALVPSDPGPKPLPPAGSALSMLHEVSIGHEPVRVNGGKMFDGRREVSREVVMPGDHF